MAVVESEWYGAHVAAPAAERQCSPLASLPAPRSHRCLQQCLSISVSYLLIKVEVLKSPV